MTPFADKIKTYFIQNRQNVITVLYALLSSVLIYYGLELGNHNPFMNGLLFTGLNVLTVFFIIAAVYVLVQRWWVASLVIALPMAILSIANNYTLLYRNFPISTQDLHNAATAMDVLKGYSLEINLYVLGIIIVFILLVYVSLLLRRLERGKRYALKTILMRDVSIILIGAAFMYATYFSKHPIKPKDTFLWSWKDSYHTYGYMANTIEIMQQSWNVVAKPDGYSEKSLEKMVMDKVKPTKVKRKPDIIFILNETFYDMRDALDLGSTPSVMPFIDSLPEEQKGRAVVAATGGSTNKSEYELLTSNSMQLMQGITPFNYLNFENANSIVSHLKRNGYVTLGAHCADSLNYSRNKVYPQLGFDEILFDTDFEGSGTYYERPYCTDSGSYARILESYEKMGDAPRFMYLLTMQNHGGWALNPEERDLVKVDADFGEYTDDVNEYLSCISLTDTAFKELTEYFEDSGREVIICMVGDHCPSFMSDIVSENSMEETLKLRSTPYVIWSNFELETDLTETISLPYVAPMLLEAGGCPTSPFYEYMNQMRKDVPIITAFDSYIGENGTVYSYGEKSPYKDTVNTYLSMVYNNSSTDAKKIRSLYEPIND